MEDDKQSQSNLQVTSSENTENDEESKPKRPKTECPVHCPYDATYSTFEHKFNAELLSPNSTAQGATAKVKEESPSPPGGPIISMHAVLERKNETMLHNESTSHALLPTERYDVQRY